MAIVQRDSGRYQVKVRNGAGKWESGGTFRLLEDAEREERRLKDKKDRGDLAPSATKLTVAELWAEFLDLHVSSLDSSTQRKWAGKWMPSARSLDDGFLPKPWHLGHYWAKHPLSAVTFETIKAWHAKMRKAGASDATLWTAHDALSALLNYAWQRGILARNPAAQAGRPKYRPGKVLPSSVWLPDTIERIRDELRARALDGRATCRWKRERDMVLVSVLGYCGLRPWDEGTTLQWPWVNERTLTIPDTKTGEERSVPMIQSVIDDLARWRARCGNPKRGLVFPREEEHIGLATREVPTINGGTWTPKVWKPALERAGIDYQRPYHLRHSCISMWLAEGARHNVVARRAGHSVAVLIGTYDHVIEEWEDRTLDVEAEVRRARGLDRDARHLRVVA